MKKIYTLTLIIMIAFSGAKAQVVLNEIYTSPGGGNQEFFDLYNSST